jgi:ubiquinone/menaquinone biosynthesis C-methylase UbiE
MTSKQDVSAQFGRTAKAYATSAGHAHGSDLTIVLELLNPQAHMRVLDVATGAGHTAAAVAPFVAEVVASDLVPEMIAETQLLFSTRRLQNATAVVSDVEQLVFPDNSFDAITCRIAPHHFLDIHKALREIARVLKPGGVFVVEDSCAPQAVRQDRFINELETLRDPTHIRAYTKKQWKDMLYGAGLRTVRLRDYRKTHDVADWIQRSDLSAVQQAKVWDAFANAPDWARKRFAITYEDGRAKSYSDDKVIIKAVKDDWSF